MRSQTVVGERIAPHKSMTTAMSDERQATQLACRWLVYKKKIQTKTKIKKKKGKTEIVKRYSANINDRLNADYQQATTNTLRTFKCCAVSVY